MKVFFLYPHPVCRCEDRMQAQRDGKFFYTTAHAGYVFKDTEGVPRRRDGRPFVWVTCKWCGLDLLVDDD